MRSQNTKAARICSYGIVFVMLEHFLWPLLTNKTFNGVTFPGLFSPVIYSPMALAESTQPIRINARPTWPGTISRLRNNMRSTGTGPFVYLCSHFLPEGKSCGKSCQFCYFSEFRHVGGIIPPTLSLTSPRRLPPEFRKIANY